MEEKVHQPAPNQGALKLLVDLVCALSKVNSIETVDVP